VNSESPEGGGNIAHVLISWGQWNPDYPQIPHIIPVEGLPAPL
jgi:hypothetical protein